MTHGLAAVTDITTVSAIFIQHSTSLHDAARNRLGTFTSTYENLNDDHRLTVGSGCGVTSRMLLRGMYASLCGRYAAEHFLG